MVFSNRGDGFNESFLSRLIRAISAPFQAFSDEAFSGRKSSMSEGNGIVSILTAPFRFLAGFVVFLVQAWASSRSGLAFILGFPAVLVAGIFLFGVWGAGFLQNRLYACVNHGFQKSAERLSDPKTLAAAFQDRAMFADRMVKLRPESKSDLFTLGDAKGRAGDIPAALDIMKFLAPDNSVGYSDAHLWRAGYYQNEQWYQAEDDERDEIVLNQLDLAIQEQEDNKDAHKSMSVIYLRKAAAFDDDSEEQREYYKQALEHLAAMVDGGIQSIDHLLATMQIVEVQKKLYGVEQARKVFDSMYEKILEPASKRNPNIFQIWVVLVKCAVALEDFPLAKKYVRDGFVTASSNDVRKQIADLSSLVLLHEADIAEDMADPDDYQKRLYALTRAISVNPKNEEIYARLVKFIDSGSEDHYNLEWFEEAKVAAPDPGVLSTMLGLRAMIDGDEEVARTHWRVSQQLYTLSELVLNHLILVGAKADLKDFGDPIDLLTKSLSAFPENPFLLQTRGYFLIKSGKDREAVDDLELAVQKLPKLVEARQFLILLYERMGDAAKVASHQQQQNDVLDKLPEDRRVKLVDQLDKVTL